MMVALVVDNRPGSVWIRRPLTPAAAPALTGTCPGIPEPIPPPRLVWRKNI